MRVQGRGNHYSISLPVVLFMSSLFILPLLLLAVVPSASAANSMESDKDPTGAGKSGKITKESSCFCSIDSGILEDCPCHISTIDVFNRDTVHSKVSYFCVSSHSHFV